MEDKEKNEIRALLTILGEKLQKPENSWLFEDLRRMLDNVDISDIRSVLNIKGLRSIDYSFLDKDTEKRLREQLEVDNIRMENAAVTTRIIDEVERFYTFCVNAFYQIENMVNYYYHVKFYDNDSFQADKFFNYISNNSNFKKLDNRNYETVADVDVSFKLFALNKSFLNKARISDLRKLRNEGLHKCSIILKNKEEENPIFKFFQEESYNSIRALLKRFVNDIRNDLNISKKTKEQNEESTCLATIETVLPSSFCFTVIEEGLKRTYICNKKLKEGIKKGDSIIIKDLRVIVKNKVEIGDYSKHNG